MELSFQSVIINVCFSKSKYAKNYMMIILYFSIFEFCCANYLMYFACFLFLGINIFLDGFVPTENLRFRDTSLTFKVAETADKVLSLFFK